MGGRTGSMSDNLLKSYASAKDIMEPKINAHTQEDFMMDNKNVEDTPAFRSPTNEEEYVENFKNLTVDEKRERIAERAKISWKPSIVFNPQANKVKTKQRLEAMVGDWARLQRGWKNINDADKDDICDYFRSLQNIEP